MRLGLVPIGYGIVVVRAIIGIPVLYCGFERLRKSDRGVEMKTIHTRSAARQLFSYDRRSIKLIRKWLAAKIPCAKKVVFRTCADDRRSVSAVNKEHVIAFTPPSILILQHRHGYANILPVPFRIHPDVVVFAI